MDRDRARESAVHGAHGQGGRERQHRPQQDVLENRHPEDHGREAGVHDVETVEDVRDHRDRGDRYGDPEHQCDRGRNAVGARHGVQRQRLRETEGQEERERRAAGKQPRRRPSVLLGQHVASSGTGDEHEKQQAQVVETREHRRRPASVGSKQIGNGTV